MGGNKGSHDISSLNSFFLLCAFGLRSSAVTLLCTQRGRIGKKAFKHQLLRFQESLQQHRGTSTSYGNKTPQLEHGTVLQNSVVQGSEPVTGARRPKALNELSY